jgi:GNAT superfamily N-acetyltransferase
VPEQFPTGAPARDRQLQRYLRATAPQGRDIERVGPFLATYDPTTDHPYLNYAIPDDDAEPTADDVAALIAAYAARGRVARLEYLPAAAPAVEAALLAGGLALEARLAVMTCGAAELRTPADPPGVQLARPADAGERFAMAVAQHAAFGEPPPERDAFDDDGDDTPTGAIRILARDVATGEIVGGGVATTPADATTEIAGIGVLASHRRRGIAGAITARLAREAFAAGVTTAFLTPGGDDAHRVYARAGFADTTEMLHLRLPEG